MKKFKTKTALIIFIGILTAAVIAAVFFEGLLLPGYSKPSDRTKTDDATGITVIQKQRKIEVLSDDEMIWELPKGVLAQDFLLEDIDHDSENELLILCWKRGRFGKHKPTWVKHDEIGWSQHIFIYEIQGRKVIPKWMASDIGMKAASWKFEDGILSITDTDKITTNWAWIVWGLEKV